MSKPPIVVLLLPRPRDTTTLSVGHIYLGVQIFPLLYCVTSLEQLTVENVSVLRKGEYHSKECVAAVQPSQSYTGVHQQHVNAKASQRHHCSWLVQHQILFLTVLNGTFARYLCNYLLAPQKCTFCTNICEEEKVF